MSTNEQTPLSQPTSAVRNTLGREQAPQNLVRPVLDEDLREYCDKNYHQILPIITEKLHQEKVQQKKLKAVKARLNFEEASQYSESETPNIRRNLKEMLGPRGARTRSISPEQRRDRSKSPREKGPERRTMFKRLEKGVFHRLGDKEKNVSAHSRGSERKSYYSSRRETASCYQSSRSKETEIASEKHRHKREYSRRTEAESESEGKILALDKGKFKPPPSMTIPVEKRNASKFCEFHGKVGHTTDECMHLKRQIEEMLKAGKLSHLIKELKAKQQERSGKDSKEGGNLRKRQTAGNIDVATMVKNSEAKDHSNFLPEINIVASRIGDEEHSTSARMNFMVVRSPSPYNGIIGRPGVRKIRAIPSTAHGMIKFPVAGGIVTLQSSRIISLECSMVSEPEVSHPSINQVKEEKIQVAIQPEHPEQTVAIGSTLTEEGRKELCRLLRRHIDVFAWKQADMTGVLRHTAEHRLNVREGCLPVRQKKGDKRLKEIKQSVRNWRMCVDFKDLNKACPKDGYPLPEIDWKVESLCGYPYKCFLDAYKGYHQIKMAEEDEEKTAFITSQGIFCYSKMPFGLKNAGATYQLIKSRTEEKVVRDAEETLKTLKKINMKLNPKKCAFGMREGTFLGYKVDADGLRVSPENLKAVIDLPSPKFLKDVQKLNGKLASLNKFLSKSAEKSLPFFKTLKKSAKEAFSAVLMTKRDGKQVPIYFVSRALQGPEVNYTPMEKLILALVSASKQLKRYFQAHTIDVITDQPIKQLLSNPKVTGRLLKWRFKLGEHDIHYRPRTSVKGQILADFIVDRPEDGTPDTPMKDREELPDPWILFTDGSSCVDGSEDGLIIMNPKGMEFTYALRFRFNATNNEEEYEALIAGLRIARLSIKKIPRGENKKADALSKIASTSFAHLSKQVLVEELREKPIGEKEILVVVEEEGHTWMTPIYEYLTKGALLKENKKSRIVRRKAGRYAVICKVFYKKSFLSPWLRCVGPLQANYVLREIHEGSCSMRAGPRYVVEKALRLGYFWPTMHTDARNLIRECKDCLVHRPDKVKFLIVAIDYFTKCIKAKPVASITGTQVKKFVWDNIICRFGIPGEAEEVSHVLWAHHTMIKSSNGETPFSLTYGTEAVIPAETGMPTLRTAEVDVARNNEALGISLDLLEEKREQVAIQEARSKAKMEGYYNAIV
nr:reverse transcriptase domain-containing protein [Tanacetum cinerariifolium]